MKRSDLPFQIGQRVEERGGENVCAVPSPAAEDRDRAALWRDARAENRCDGAREVEAGQDAFSDRFRKRKAFSAADTGVPIPVDHNRPADDVQPTERPGSDTRLDADTEVSIDDPTGVLRALECAECGLLVAQRLLWNAARDVERHQLPIQPEEWGDSLDSRSFGWLL